MPAPKKTAPKKTTAKKDAKPASKEDMHKTLATKKQDLLDAKRSHKSGELVNPRVLGQTRKEIARLHTAIRAEELKQAKESK